MNDFNKKDALTDIVEEVSSNKKPQRTDIADGHVVASDGSIIQLEHTKKQNIISTKEMMKITNILKKSIIKVIKSIRN